MTPELILSIVGGFGAIGLTINAYFLRGIFQDLNDVKIKLARIHSDSVHAKEEIEKMEKNIEILRSKNHKLSNSLMRLEAKVNSIEKEL